MDKQVNPESKTQQEQQQQPEPPKLSSAQEQSQMLQQLLVQQLAPLQSAVQELKLQQDQLRLSVQPKPQPSDLKSILDEIDDESEVDDKYDKLSNKQLVDVVCSAMDTALESHTESLKKDLSGITQPGLEKVNNLERAVMAIAANLGVGAARQKFTDFDEYKKEIEQVIIKYPGIDFDDAYLLAKSKRASNTPPKNQIDTEKPQSFATNPSARSQQHINNNDLEIIAARGRESRGGSTNQGGVVGFRNAVNAAIEKVLSARE